MRGSGDDDTVPATGDREREERERRATMPEIAPPFEERYRLGVELGRGGMGRVVEAFDTQLGRTVALKEVLPKTGSTTIERRFEREIQITARLEHASIVPLYDAGTMPDGRPFYVMRRVSGRPLDELLAKSGGLDERMALLPNLLAAIDAVAHAHRRGIIHRDLKPANILVGELGETVVIDWGLAKVIGEKSEPPETDVKVPSAADSLQTQMGSVFGTPGFMPPEQARGEELGPRGDVFALGATLYQLLVGRPPVSGKSATDAIASSMVRRIEHIASAAPGAPPELVAIAEKALAFEAIDRYPNADKLGEDVRRFLTGQVVAAHRYTRRERIARFARRHRAPLSVAALALVAVAVLAWIGVHRIVVERDAATEARREAEVQRENVEHANIELVERQDSLLVTKARALVDSNPTNAIAILKELRPGSGKVADARAIAQAAVVRGVGWGLRSDGEPREVTLDRGGARLAVTTADSTLHVWDLETHRVMYEHTYTHDVRPLWIDHGRLLLLRRNEAPDILDPKTGIAERVSIPPAWFGIPTDVGDRVALLDDAGTVMVLDVATRAVTTMWAGHKARMIAFDARGRWVAAGDGKVCVVLDATGAELTHHDGDLAIDGPFSHHVTVFDNTASPPKAFELDLEGPALTWRELPLELPANKTVLIGSYHRGKRLEIVTSIGVLGFDKGKLVGRAALGEYNPLMIGQAGDDVAVTTTQEGNLHFSSDSAEGTIVLPVPMSSARLAGRPGSSRIVAASAGIVLVYDLADILPRSVPKVGVFAAEFADDDTLLLWPGDDGFYHWQDLLTGTNTRIDHAMIGPGVVTSIDPRDGRILMTEQISNDRELELSVFTKGSSKVHPVARGKRLVGRLVPGGVLFASAGDPRVLVSMHDEPPHELAKVEGGMQSLATLDNLRFAALGRSGELVRGSITGGALERVHVDVGPEAFVGADRAGHPLVVTGSRLLIWDGAAPRDLVKLARPVIELHATSGGVIATLDDNEAIYVEIGTRVVLHTVVNASGNPPAIGADGGWLATAGNGGQVTIVELPSLAQWTVPVRYVTFGAFLVASPSKRRLMQGTGRLLEIVNLPEPSADLAAWIEDRTNAFETGDGVLTWPWQRP